MATYYPQYHFQHRYTYPITMTEWIPISNSIEAHSPIITPSVLPFVLTPTQVVTQICPYTGTLLTESVLPSIISNPVITEIIPILSDIPIGCYTTAETSLSPMVEQCCSADEVLMNQIPDVNYEDTQDQIPDVNYEDTQDQIPDVNYEDTQDKIPDVNYEDTQLDPIEFYLTLPKELFPSARMFSLDPNPIIDEFCKLVNLNENTSWILDLEFGIPRIPITRAIPVYDVQFNSIHCKNTPGAIHPGFESCSYDFKRVLIFYYDCIVSAWYKGYIIMNYDKSVKNFQSWLLLPMQLFGMCWA